MGILPIVRRYLQRMSLDAELKKKLDEYLRFVSMRASGKLMTTATWIRKFVTSHPAYEQNSVVKDEIVYDLMAAIWDLEQGKNVPPELLGDFDVQSHRYVGDDIRYGEGGCTP